MLYTENYINEKIEEIKQEVKKTINYLKYKIKSKTLTSNDLVKYKEYFSNYIQEKFKLDFYDIDELNNMIENMNKYIHETMLKWPNLKTSDKFSVFSNIISEKVIQLECEDIIIFDKIFLFLQDTLGDSVTYCMLYKDYLRGNITLKQMLDIINLKDEND